MIWAEVHSDDHRSKAQFDATPWFKQAEDQEIAALAKVDWGGDYEADAVARFCADLDPGVKRVFDYLEANPNMPGSRDRQGFECHIIGQDALAWLKINRPDLFNALSN